MKRHSLILALGLAASCLAVPASAKTLKIVASFSVLADVVHEIGGPSVEVKSLVGPNGDPHEFEPSPTDAKTLKAAELVVISGEGLEGWMDRLIAASGYAGKPVVVSDGIKTRTMEEDGKTLTDPHVWNSPVNVEIWVANIEKALETADPKSAAHFKANAESYTAKLKTLNVEAHRKLDDVAQSERKILTSHDAFGYFGAEYGVTFLAPIGLSTETEASAADVAKLIDQIKAEKVKAYFFENSNDSRLVKQIAQATGAAPGGELFVESLSPADGPAPTYLKMFNHNLALISAALAQRS
jgi:zinc/manganese transport system substrate-binding protein